MKFQQIGKFFHSLVTDVDWDADLTKVSGLALIVVGVVGYFKGLDPTFMVGFGSTLIATGKFSKQG